MSLGEGKAWWSESRFGMFIHWGIYSIKAKGEWVMYSERIPVKEYETLAEQFNPVPFDAEEWVKLAERAGMKYIVITAKHHDGFSMFKTNVDKYNIVDRTPYGRDVMADLSQACERHGIRLCFYYSHVREWRNPNAQSLEKKAPSLYGNYGNFWDYPDEAKKDLQKYIDEFDKPQLRELLTQYGPIGIIWFDTPSLIRPDQAEELRCLVKELQPECLVNSRIGDYVKADYYSLGDDQVPEFNNGVDFETPMTICHAWGYNNRPENRYRPVRELKRQLVDIVSLGGNYLLNVGPDAHGIIPHEAQERLEEIGRWMKGNGEAIYGTKASPFPNKPSWGKITAKQNVLYLHLYEWRNEISLTGIKSQAESAVLLADPERPVTWEQKACSDLGYDRLTLTVPGDAPDPDISVIKVRFREEVRTEEHLIEDDYGNIQLPACLAAVHGGDGGSEGAGEETAPNVSVNITGAVQNWFSEKDWFSWEFLCEHPGEYEVLLTAGTDFLGLWDFDHRIAVEYETAVNEVLIDDTGIPTYGYQKRTWNAGRIRIETEGLHTIAVKALSLNRAQGQGFPMTMVRLSPVQQPYGQ